MPEPKVYHIKTNKTEFDLKVDFNRLEFITCSSNGPVKITEIISLDKNNVFHCEQKKEAQTDGRASFELSKQHSSVTVDDKEYSLDTLKPLVNKNHVDVAAAVKKGISLLIANGINENDAEQIANLKMLIDNGLKTDFGNYSSLNIINAAKPVKPTQNNINR